MAPRRDPRRIAKPLGPFMAVHLTIVTYPYGQSDRRTVLETGPFDPMLPTV